MWTNCKCKKETFQFNGAFLFVAGGNVYLGGWVTGGEGGGGEEGGGREAGEGGGGRGEADETTENKM